MRNYRHRLFGGKINETTACPGPDLMRRLELIDFRGGEEKAPAVDYDPYTKTINITGRSRLHNALLDPNKWAYWLSATITNGVAQNPMLMFSTNTPEWYFFDRAADIDGNELPVIQGNRDVQLHGVHELFGIEMTPKYLADHRATGFNLKIMGSRGTIVVIVPAEAISTFETTWLAEVNKAGGFREDLAATRAAVAPTPDQIAHAAFNAAESTASKGGFGIAFATIPQGIILAVVAPGSRAERGKLKPGQLVTAINGRNIAGMTQADVQATLKASVGTTIFTVAGLGNLGVEP